MSKRKAIGITADLHAHEHTAYARDVGGYNSRLLDAKEAILFMARKVAEAGGEHLIIAGDTLHNRKSVTIPVLHVLAAALIEAREKYKVHVCTFHGNHDMSLDGKSLSVLGLPFSESWLTGGVYELGGWKVGVIPWTDKPEDVRAVLSKKADFYVGHFGVMGARVGPSDFEIPGHIGASDLKAANAKAPIFLGHYHKPQEIPGTNAMYVGSPMELSWGEAGENKRFIIMEPSGNHKSVPLTQFPKFVKVSDEKSLKGTQNKDFVRMEIDDADKLERAKKLLADRNAQVVLKSQAEPVQPRLQLAGESVKAQLAAWTQAYPPPHGTAKEAQALGLKLISETQE